MKRIKLHKKRKMSTLSILLLLLMLLIISIILVFIYIGKNITPKIQNYAEIQAKKIISLVLSQTVTDEIIDTFKTDDLFITQENEDGTVGSIDFNSVVVNKALVSISKNVKSYLKKLENGEIEDIGLSDSSLLNVEEKKLKNGIIYEVPTGIIFDNGMLSNIGPKIPVKLSFLGDVTCDVVTDITDYGINNAIVEIGIKIVVTEQVVLPYDTSQIEIETTIPITIKLIQGTVPNYYFNGTENPSLSLSTN
jgi:sporulation protein YunB